MKSIVRVFACLIGMAALVAGCGDIDQAQSAKVTTVVKRVGPLVTSASAGPCNQGLMEKAGPCNGAL